MSSTLKKWLMMLVLYGVVWFTPTPDGLTWGAWHLFAVFITVILGFILQPIPMGAIAMCGIALVCMLKILSAKVVLGGFGNPTLWLIVGAFFFAKGFEKTGLGRRIAFIVIRAFGKKSISLAYSVTIADLILGPAIPSNTARLGGVLFPIAQSLSEAYDSRPGQTARKLGAFLLTSIFQADAIVSAIFLTSMAANPLIADFADKTLGVHLTWISWVEASIVPGIIGLLIVPFIIFMLVKPEIKETPKASQLANEELAKMGPISFHEKIMAVIFLGALILWITAGVTHVDNTIVAIMGIAFMLIFGVLEWKDISSHHQAWNTFVWTGFIMLLSAQLNTSGFITWFANSLGAHLQGLPWVIVAALGYLIYLYSHYGFASQTAHVSAMYVGIISLVASAGAPPFIAAFAVAMAANVCGTLTHYGTGPAPVFFGAGYVSQGEWWKVGFIMSIINFAVLFGIGLVWWKVIGLW